MHTDHAGIISKQRCVTVLLATCNSRKDSAETNYTSTILHVILLTSKLSTSQSTIVLQLMAARSFFDIQTSSKTLRQFRPPFPRRFPRRSLVSAILINEIVMEYRCNRMKHQRGCRRIDWSYCLLSGQSKHRKHWQHLIIGPSTTEGSLSFYMSRNWKWIQHSFHSGMLSSSVENPSDSYPPDLEPSWFKGPLKRTRTACFGFPSP